MPEKQLAKSDGLTEHEIQTLISVGAIPGGTPQNVVQFFSRACADAGLSPFKRQIYLIKRGDKYTIQTAIDGFRAIADRTKRYAGSDDYVYDEGLKIIEMLHDGRNRPQTATATVYKVVGGIRCPITATVRWEEYYPGDALGFMWKKMPFLMPGKCAEALALRKAFPEELSGMYTEDEMIVQNQPTIARPIIQSLDSTLPADSGKQVEQGGGDETPVPTQVEPALTPKKKPREKEKVPPTLKKKIPSIRPNEAEISRRLMKANLNFNDLYNVCRPHEWIDEDQDTLQKIGEDRLAEFLLPQNWDFLVQEMEKLAK
jgi:phage recombination protein Bet